MDKEFRILSIDGGGIRGIYPATILKNISSSINGSIFEYFDMIVGTSTGSILALALSVDKNPVEIYNMYLERGSIIFNKKSFRWLNRGLMFTKYNNKVLYDTLREFFSDLKLGDSKTRVCIPASDVTNKKGIIYKTRHSDAYKKDYKKLIVEVAMASCSAPIYFPAFQDSDSAILVDGGLWANNPSMIGINEAIQLGYNYGNIKLLSIGTGSNLFFKSRMSLKSFGLIAWKASFIDYLFQITSRNNHDLANILIKKNYLRVNRQLESDCFKLDNTSKSSLQNLICYANDDEKENITKIKDMFFQNKTEIFVPVP